LDGGLQHRASSLPAGLSLTPGVHPFPTRCVSGLIGSTPAATSRQSAGQLKKSTVDQSLTVGHRHVVAEASIAGAISAGIPDTGKREPPVRTRGIPQRHNSYLSCSRRNPGTGHRRSIREIRERFVADRASETGDDIGRHLRIGHAAALAVPTAATVAREARAPAVINFLISLIVVSQLNP
jgi:hypothetical protein